MTAKIISGLIAGLVVGAGAGYYVGYNIGSTKAVAVNPQPTALVTASPTPINPIAQTVDPRIVSARSLLVGGQWQSEEDSGLFREYKTNGTVIDSHDSVPAVTTTSAQWTVFTADTAPAVVFQLNNKDVYIQHTPATGGPVYFRIVSVTPTTLEVMDMQTAVASRFAKVPF